MGTARQRFRVRPLPRSCSPLLSLSQSPGSAVKLPADMETAAGTCSGGHSTAAGAKVVVETSCGCLSRRLRPVQQRAVPIIPPLSSVVSSARRGEIAQTRIVSPILHPKSTTPRRVLRPIPDDADIIEFGREEPLLHSDAPEPYSSQHNHLRHEKCATYDSVCCRYCHNHFSPSRSGKVSSHTSATPVAASVSHQPHSQIELTALSEIPYFLQTRLLAPLSNTPGAEHRLKTQIRAAVALRTLSSLSNRR
jgi:hypothetical protein